MLNYKFSFWCWFSRKKKLCKDTERQDEMTVKEIACGDSVWREKEKEIKRNKMFLS